MIKVSKIKKSYGDFQALDDVSFEIKSGETVAILGKSGSGKSTLMHILSGLDRPDSGIVEINDKNIFKMNNSEIDSFRNNFIGFVFQTFYLLPHETVLSNVMLPMEIKGESFSVRKNKALEVLKFVELADKANSKGKNLSGGQKQRLCIARAMINSPKIIFADEPTGNLDSESGQKVIETLMNLNKNQKTTIVFVTHDEDLAKLCHKKIELKDGKLLNNVKNS